MRRLVKLLLALGVLLAAAPAGAVQPDEILDDPALEARARAISLDLRCLVCQNQSIDDSDAPLARDLRLLVRDRLRAGASDAEVMDFVVARYGEFVLMRPRFAPHTYALWLAPPILLLLAGFVALRAHRRRRSGEAAESEPLTAAERRRLDKLLQGG